MKRGTSEMDVSSGALFGVWIPVEDRLPGKANGYWSEDVLVHNSAGWTRIDSYYHGDDRGFWNIHRGPTTATVTHWMPLPDDPPNAEAHGRRSRTVQPLVGASESQPKGE